MKSKQMTYIVLVVAVIAVLFLIGMNAPGSWAGNEGFAAGADGTNTFTLYYADWCPHCKAVKPIVQSLKEESPLKIKGQMVFIDLAEADKDAAKVQAAGVKGFPTMQLKDSTGTIKEFDGERTDAGIRSWLQSNI